MSKIFIIGHQSPDTDSITSALSLSYLQNTLGKNTEAIALGLPNEETQYALNYFNTKAPRVITKASDETKDVILVDHNEFQQSVSDIAKLNILGVVDHHRISNFHTINPLYYRAEPVGCTQTIILKLYKEHSVNIPKDIAGLMVSAIVSDTLLLKSPTCTEEDIKAAHELAKIAEVDLEEYGMDLLKAGTNLTNKTAENLVFMDTKSFEVEGEKVKVSQVNCIDYNDVFSKEEEIRKIINKEIEINKINLFLFIATNILENNSTVLVIGNASSYFEEAFCTKLENNKAILKNIVSRKKQIIPQLTKVLCSIK